LTERLSANQKFIHKNVLTVQISLLQRFLRLLRWIIDAQRKTLSDIMSWWYRSAEKSRIILC